MRWLRDLCCQQRNLKLMVVIGVVVAYLLSGSRASSQAATIYDQLIQLKINQPFPESLQKQAESNSKRGDKQTYYFLSGNYVYPHFIETEHGLVVHGAVYLDSVKSAEYNQKLQAAGSPEIVLQNTENESIFGFPTKGMVFVVNAQKLPVVYEWMQPRTEREIVQTYDTETVLAAADSIETSDDPRALLMSYPAEVVAFAVGFYTALIENPQMVIVVFAVGIALVITLKIVRSIKQSAALHRESKIAQLMQETVAINRQREQAAAAAAVAETVMVPTQHVTEAHSAAPVFDASMIEAVSPDVVAEASAAQLSEATESASPEQAAAASAYNTPADTELQQMLEHNPQLRGKQLDDQSNSEVQSTEQTEQVSNSAEPTPDSTPA